MYDGRAVYHVRRFPRPSPSVFAYWKRSKAGGVEGLGTRLGAHTFAGGNSYYLEIAVHVSYIQHVHGNHGHGLV